MGVDVLFFVDHDLPTDSADNFIAALEMRKHRDKSWQLLDEQIYKDKDTICKVYPNYNASSFEHGVWVSFSNDDAEFNFILHKHAVEIEYFLINKKEVINNYRWQTVHDFLLMDSEPGKKWLAKLFDIVNTYIVPFFHSKQILLIKDSSSELHEKVCSEITEGLSINDALSIQHCSIVEKKDCFKKTRDELDHKAEPFFVFDLNEPAKLGWKKVAFSTLQFKEHKEGYVFTVDGNSLEYKAYDPVCWYDVEIKALLNNSNDDVYECPSIACCTCGYVDCDSIRAVVKFKDDYVIWTLFKLHECEDIETVMHSYIGRYTFEKEQYYQTIKSLCRDVEKEQTRRKLRR